MLESLSVAELLRVAGGACRRYASSQAELARRKGMSRSQRAAADRQWASTFSRLSPERQAAIRAQAAGNAGGNCVLPSAPAAPGTGTNDTSVDTSTTLEQQLENLRF